MVYSDIQDTALKFGDLLQLSPKGFVDLPNTPSLFQITLSSVGQLNRKDKTIEKCGSRGRSVKLASAHDTWRADAPGKIGSANIEKAPNRVSFLPTFNNRGMKKNFRHVGLPPTDGGFSYSGCNLKVILHILREQSRRLIHSSRLF